MTGEPVFVDVVVPKTPLDELTYRLNSGQIGVVCPGDLVQVPLRRRTVTGVVVQVRNQAEPPVPNLQLVLNVVAPRLLGPDLLQLMRWAAEYYICHLGEVLELILPRFVTARFAAATVPVAPLEDNGESLPRELERLFAGGKPGVWVTADPEEFDRIFLPFIRRGLKCGSVILLMPEARRPQLLPLLRAELGERVIEYHHELLPRERRSAWQKIVTGNYLVAGLRSAVWLPVRQLAGMVVVDEQADAFKEERFPCYHARDVAIARARFASCPVLLLGTPPSVETWWNLRQRRYRLIGRVNFRTDRTRIFIVDMRYHRHELISPRVLHELRRVLTRQKPALCYINRLGVSRYVVCADCGTVLKCPQCQLPGVLTGAGKIVCPVCGAAAEAPEQCAVCQSRNFDYRAPGVEMVIRELRRNGIDCYRVDTGTAIGPVAGAAAAGFAPVRVGTRAALRADRSGLPDLVVVLNFDTELTIPDFRSRERAFSLLVTLLRWRPARLIIQTTRPEDPVLAYARRGDVSGFLEEELRIREEAGFPPWRRLVAISLSGDEEMVFAGIEKISAELSALSEVELLGPIKLRQRRRGQPAYRLIVKLPRQLLPGRLIRRQLLEDARVRVRIDVDPRQLF